MCSHQRISSSLCSDISALSLTFGLGTSYLHQPPSPTPRRLVLRLRMLVECSSKEGGQNHLHAYINLRRLLLLSARISPYQLPILLHVCQVGWPLFGNAHSGQSVTLNNYPTRETKTAIRSSAMPLYAALAFSFALDLFPAEEHLLPRFADRRHLAIPPIYCPLTLTSLGVPISPCYFPLSFSRLFGNLYSLVHRSKSKHTELLMLNVNKLHSVTVG